MFDMFEVRFWAKMWCSEVFEVQNGCYVTRLVLEHTVWCSWTVQFFVMFNMFEVQFWAKMWCPESLMFGQSMFGVFEVQYFGVRSKISRYIVNWFFKNSPNTSNNQKNLPPPPTFFLRWNSTTPNIWSYYVSSASHPPNVPTYIHIWRRLEVASESTL